MIFGGQTVAFVSYADTGVTSALGTRQKVETLTEETWKTTAPPTPVVLSAKAGDVIRVNGVTYHLIGGPQPHADLSGRPFKVTFTSRRHVG